MTFDAGSYVQWFRQSSPYINAHRGRVIVVGVDGEAVASPEFPNLVHDLALLNSLGIKLVVVVGARPQIEQRLRERDIELQYHGGLRITDARALDCVKEAVGAIRVEVEALMSMGLANSPMAGFRIKVASGNFVTARPLGVRDGVDFQHTGEVRRIDVGAIRERLDEGAVVTIAPLGYSPTGEVFNLSAEEVALAVARDLRADKLVFLTESDMITGEDGRLIREMSLAEAVGYVRERSADLSDAVLRLLDGLVLACRAGVQRVHLLDRHIDGALLLELFTRDGVGTLITADSFESVRSATVDDVGGVLELIQPLEREGVLVRRSREVLETEIGHFTVVERDGMIIATAALYPHATEGMAELACFAVHPEYRGGERGDRLLRQVEREARQQGLDRLFVLTTRAAHWFRERGFEPASLDELPVARRELYNLKRNSKVFLKKL